MIYVGLSVAGSGGTAFAAASVANVIVANGLRVEFENNVGVTKFVVGRLNAVTVGGPSYVRNNSGLVTYCDVVGLNDRSVVNVSNNANLNPNCDRMDEHAVWRGVQWEWRDRRSVCVSLREGV